MSKIATRTLKVADEILEGLYINDATEEDRIYIAGMLLDAEKRGAEIMLQAMLQVSKVPAWHKDELKFGCKLYISQLDDAISNLSEAAQQLQNMDVPEPPAQEEGVAELVEG